MSLPALVQVVPCDQALAYYHELVSVWLSEGAESVAMLHTTIDQWIFWQGATIGALVSAFVCLLVTMFTVKFMLTAMRKMVQDTAPNDFELPEGAYTEDDYCDLPDPSPLKDGEEPPF